MRKTSHDGGDSTSITSGVENEIKKSAMKPKKSSLKRKAPSFSQESDDTVIEPLLQREKEKSEPQSAKYFGKGKTDSLQNKESDNKAKQTSTEFCGTTESLLSFKESEMTKTTAGAAPPLHSYMNTNVFNTHDNTKAKVMTKSQILVEIESSKQSSYTPSPLIFTTAKIHTDAKTRQMEPVHVTPVPILSTIEVSVSKGGNITTNEKKISNGSSVINPISSPMPLTKVEEEKVTGSCLATVISPTIHKDTFANAITVTSAAKLVNVTTAPSSSMKMSLPSTTSNTLLMKSNTNDKQGDDKHIKSDQELPHNVQSQLKLFNLNSTKNNATVRTIIPSSEKTIDITTISANTCQIDKSQTQQPNVCDEGAENVSSYNSEKVTSNDKPQTSQNLVGTSVKNTSNGNKQLQRQKTTKEDVIDSESKSEKTAKQKSSSHPKIIDSISITDKLPNISANNSKIIIKSPIPIPPITNKYANSINKTTSIQTTAKPIVTSVDSSTTVTTSADVLSKPSTTNTISDTGKTISPTTTSTKAISNVNRISTASTISSINNTCKKDNILPTSIYTTKCPEVTAMQTQPQTSISKKLQGNTHETNAERVSSDKSTIIKQSPVLTTASTIVTQPLSSSSTKETDSKPISVTTSTKKISASPITSTKPNSGTTQVSSSKLPLTSSLVSAVKTPATTSSIPKTLSNTGCSMSQTITSIPGSKQAVTTVGTNAIKATSVTTGKTSTVNSGIPASIAASVKSPNNNSSQGFGTSKPYMTSIPKTDSITTLPRTSPGSSSNIATVSTYITKSSQGLITKSNTKDTTASVKKPAVTKTSIATKISPMSSTNKSVAGTTTKISSSEASSTPSATKKHASPVSAKNNTATSTIKSPSVAMLTKTSDITSSSSTTTSTAKPATSVMQVSANKSVGIAGSSVPSSTPVLRPSESIKKGGSKSSENNKDGKVSKA